VKVLEKLAVTASYGTAPHQRALQKPNEDRLLSDPENGVFIVLDGVTRVHEEYIESPYQSAAAEVAELFLEAVYNGLLEGPRGAEPEALLRCAIGAANKKIAAYRAQKAETQWGFFPSATGLIALLRDSTLHYAAAGDCIGMLLRGSSKQLFGCQWQLEAVDTLQVSKQERYSRYCNHPDAPLSYTVFNGDGLVADSVDYSYLDLHRGDTVLLASVGLTIHLKYEDIRKLRSQTPEEMIAASAAYDQPPFGSYADDKTVIKLSF